MAELGRRSIGLTACASRPRRDVHPHRSSIHSTSIVGSTAAIRTYLAEHVSRYDPTTIDEIRQLGVRPGGEDAALSSWGRGSLCRR
jgi:hypothetical protein